MDDTARRALVAFLRDRIDGGTPLTTDARVAEMAGLDAAAVAAARPAIAAWCAENHLPNVATAIICADRAGKMQMLPPADHVDGFGGEAQVRAEQARVRDFDWAGWRDA